MPTDLELIDEIQRLGPWHHKVHVRNDIHTGSDSQFDASGRPVSLIDPVARFKRNIKVVLPKGMEGRSFLDCGCNCGGYTFAAKEAGASRLLGFDAREHWIRQANFLLENREASSEGIRFEVANLEDAGKYGETFDITWFSGLLYHLPDPIGGLKLVADKTTEILFLNTATLPLTKPDDEVPGFQYSKEDPNAVMSGVDGMSWTPSGPKVLKTVLHWLGFIETRTVMWNHKTSVKKGMERGRVAIVAAREKGRLDGLNEVNTIEMKEDARVAIVREARRARNRA